MSQSITVPLLDLKAQYAPLRDEMVAAMNEVVEAQWFIMGPKVKELESEIAEYCHAKHAIGCASGSDALLLALMAIGIEPGMRFAVREGGRTVGAGVVTALEA